MRESLTSLRSELEDDQVSIDIVVTHVFQSCPWVGLTHGLGWFGLVVGREFLFLVG